MRSLLQFTLDLFDEPAPAPAPRRARSGAGACEPGPAAPAALLADTITPPASRIRAPAARCCWATPAWPTNSRAPAPHHRLRGRRRGPERACAALGRAARRRRRRCRRRPTGSCASWAMRASASSASIPPASTGATAPAFTSWASRSRCSSIPSMPSSAPAPSSMPAPTGRAACCAWRCRSNANGTQVRDAAQAWLMRQARRIFTERLDHFAPRLGVSWRKLSPDQRRHPLGQRQRRRRHPPALAAGAFPHAGDRLRGGPRAGPSARDGPQPALLGDGGKRGAGLPAAAPGSSRKSRFRAGRDAGAFCRSSAAAISPRRRSAASISAL